MTVQIGDLKVHTWFRVVVAKSGFVPWMVRFSWGCKVTIISGSMAKSFSLGM